MYVVISSTGGIWYSKDAAAYNARYVNFFRVLFEKTRAFGNVLFEPMNEPDNIADQEWVDLTKRSIDSFRAFGYRGPLWINHNHLANPVTFNPALIDQVWAYDKNIIFSLHYYKWVGWDKAEKIFNGFSRKYPLILGEFGREGGTAGEPDAIAAAAVMVGFVKDNEVAGANAFVWNLPERNSTDHGMTRDADNLVPNGWGQGYFDKFSSVLPDVLPGPGPTAIALPMMSTAKVPVPLGLVPPQDPPHLPPTQPKKPRRLALPQPPRPERRHHFQPVPFFAAHPQFNSLSSLGGSPEKRKILLCGKRILSLCGDKIP
jgi:hypothetical protein